jgi:SAM-dependent methyltransferase
VIVKESVMKLARMLRRAFHSTSNPTPEECRLEAERAAGLLDDLDSAGLVSLAYQLVLGRGVDPVGFRDYVAQLESGHLNRAAFISSLVHSAEFRAHSLPAPFDAVHSSRLQLVAQLPRAEILVDLGGTCLGRPEGALVAMGYPYRFRSLTIVDLPPEQRHPRYADQAVTYADPIPTSQGPVRYLYTSMVDLAAIPTATVDLVYAGQALEHVTRADAHCVCREVCRILRPGAWFCLDTPNRTVTRLQFPSHYIDPDHRYEYTARELAALLTLNGLHIREAKGLCLMQDSVRRGKFREEELRGHAGIYDDPENCYLLYYKCQSATF